MTAQTVKVPDGPGSVRGLASDAAVSSFTGQVAYAIPIELPAGPGGLTPSLTLHYNGALGNGPVGLGWSLGHVGVRRSLRLGVPSYTDADELELFGLSGATLVPIGNGQFRAEGQGNAIRGVAVDGGFELVDAAGTRYRVGTSAASRLASGSSVAAWLLERVTDVAGHVIDYSYDADGGGLYLRSIAWGGPGAFRADLVYEARPDVVVSWRTGFRSAATRRLTRIQVWSFGAIRRTVELAYDSSSVFALSRLASLRVVGPDGTALPTTTLSYAAPAVGQAQFLTNTGGWSLGSTISFFDVDKDGAMDLVRIEAGSHRYRRNLGGTFGPEVPIGNAPAVAMASVRMLDLDGDSGAEMVSKSGSSWRSYRIVDGSWVATDWPGSSAIPLSTVAVADLNGDNRMDALAVSGSGIVVWLGTANGFAAPRTLPAISPGEPGITPATAQFPDINGDGLADAVLLGSSGITEFLGRGDGTFERVGVIPYPWTGTTDTTQLRLADLDRDGLLDLVRVGTSQVFWYRGRPNGSFASQATVLSRPPGADATTVVGLADANGNGSTDVVWSSPSGMWALDLAGPTHAGLLVAIDNGLGKVQRFGYTASAQLAWSAETAGAAWTVKMPVSIAVATTQQQTLASGDADRTTLLAVRDGIYDDGERRFLGFAQSIQTFPGASAADTTRVITQFHPGRGGDRVLRGLVLSARTEDGAGNVFNTVENQVAALPVAGLPADPRLLRAAVTQTQTTRSELGEAPVVVRTRYAFDAEARMIEERHDGTVVPGVALDGDESIVRRTYTAEDPATGVRDAVCEEVVLDGAEHVVSDTQRLFGDAASVAALCQPGNGWMREELGYLAEEGRWVSLARTSYDSDGNPIAQHTGGVDRVLAYDAHGVHPIAESVTPSPGQVLTWTARWDDVAGTLLDVTGADGLTTHMTYDGLGRVTSLAMNAAPPHIYYRYSWAAPRPVTETFVFDGDPASLDALPSTWTPDSGWRHSMTVATSAGEQLLTAVQLDVTRWTIGELRQRDRRGRVIARTDAFVFDGAVPSQATPPAGAATEQLTYDPLDRVTDQLLASGTHKRTTYHPHGVTVAGDGLASITSVLDGQDRITHTERTIGNVVESVDATYDARGRIVQFRLQGDAIHHDFTYDSLGRLVHASDPDVGPRSLAYDDAGRLVRSENGAGDVVTYDYDGAGRLLDVGGPGVTTHYHYDAARRDGFANTAGQLAWVEEPTGTVDFGYDDHRRLATLERTIVDVSSTITGREATAFAPSGLIRSVDLGDGVVLPMHHDAAGRLTQIEGIWTAESLDAAGKPLRERFGNDIVQSYERDLLHRPTRVTVANSGRALYDVVGRYNAFGALEALTDQDQVGLDHTASFGYDGAGRLTSATVGAYQFGYGYDGLQNMIHREASGPTELGILAGTYQYSPQSPRRLSQIVSDTGDPIAAFAYDAAGRQTQHAGKQLHYDALSHLTRVDGAAGGFVEHRYGYDGNRVATRNAAGTMTYWITPNVVVRGDERDHYVHVGDRVVAKVTTSSAPGDQPAVAGIIASRGGAAAISLLAAVGILGISYLGSRGRRARRRLRGALALGGLAVLLAGTSCRVATSLHTSDLTAARVVSFHQTFGAGPDLTTNSAGQLEEDRRTEPFGVAIDDFRDGAVQPIDYLRDPINALNKFTDPDTRWSYHGARWLAPDTAQWHSPDPPATAPDPTFMAEPWALHPYQYVDQNPIAYWDPDGRCAAPVLSPGQVGICIEAFIGADRLGPGGIGHGDDRGFAGNDPSLTNRLEQRIMFNPDNSLTSTYSLGVSVVGDPKGVYGFVAFLAGAANGSKLPTSNLGAQGTGVATVDDISSPDWSGTTFTARGQGFNGFSGMPGAPKGSIDYAYNLRVSLAGNVSLVSGAEKGFPSYAIYAYKLDDKGNVVTTTVHEATERNISDLTAPFNGLTDKPGNGHGVTVYTDD